MNLTDICRTFHPNMKEYPFSFAVHGSFSRIDHILGRKPNIYKVKKIEINLYNLFEHKAIKFKIDSKKISSKYKLMLHKHFFKLSLFLTLLKMILFVCRHHKLQRVSVMGWGGSSLGRIHGFNPQHHIN